MPQWQRINASDTLESLKRKSDRIAETKIRRSLFQTGRELRQPTGASNREKLNEND